MTLEITLASVEPSSDPRVIFGFRIRRIGPDRWEVTDRTGKRRAIRSTFTWAKREAERLAEEEPEEFDGGLAA